MTTGSSQTRQPVAAYRIGLVIPPPGDEQVFRVAPKAGLVNIQFGGNLLRQLLEHVLLQPIGLKEPVIDVARGALPALFHHQFGVHELQGNWPTSPTRSGKQTFNTCRKASSLCENV